MRDGYTPAERRILSVLRDVRCTKDELARGLQIAPGTVSQCLYRLSDSIRAKPHPLDRRRRVYEAITDQDGGQE